MKVILLLVAVSACVALPRTPSATEASSPLPESTTSSIRTSQPAGPNNTTYKDIVDEISAAVSPLEGVGSMLAQILQAASHIIDEWKESMRTNIEAHPVFIPDRGSFILLCHDWLLPEPLEYEDSLQDNADLVVEKVSQVQNEFVNNLDPANINESKDLMNYTDIIYNNSTNVDIGENNENTTTIFQELNVTEDNITTNITNDAKVAPIEHISNNNINAKDANKYEEVEISNEIYRRSVPLTFNNDETNHSIRKSRKVTHNKDALSKIIKNFRKAKLLDDTGVIQLKNAYLVPIQGGLDLGEGASVGEALDAAMKTKQFHERKNLDTMRFLTEKLAEISQKLSTLK